MSLLYYIANDRPTLDASRYPLSPRTADIDEKGYLITSGTNRGTECALTPTDELAVYITTNGDPVAITDNDDDLINACRDLADMGRHDDEDSQAIQGAGRLLEAIDEATMRYPRADASWFLGDVAPRLNAIITQAADSHAALLGLLPPS